MKCETELGFLQKILLKVNIQTVVLRKDNPPKDALDLGIRDFLGRKEEYHHFFYELPYEMTTKTINKHTDPYLCNYIFLPISEDDSTILLIGPYMTIPLSHDQLLMEAERLSLHPNLFDDLEVYYGRIPVLREESYLLSLLYTFAETLWGDDRSYFVVSKNDNWSQPSSQTPEEELSSFEKTKLKMAEMERRYSYENELLRCVSLGLAHKAEMMLSTSNQLFLKQRGSDPLRNIKNYCIIMNTLMRKAAEKGGVHPFHLDRLSSEFAQIIDLAKSTEDGYKLMPEMVGSYCRLVNKHSMTPYSLRIRKTIECIDANLAGDLSLHTLAASQNISPAYLSSLFTTEVGATLTEYITQKRMDQAKSLLSQTVLQIQTIALYCGFQDLNYFSKTFKRYNSCTPSEFRLTQERKIEAIL